MNLLDILARLPEPEPWAEGDNIPWNEPGFSSRMLREHLTQQHDAASRRFEIIDRQVEWIHTRVLDSKPARILDLACGPGLYASRLAKLGHSCTGIDYSPASIEYARQQAAEGSLDCTYRHEDLRSADFGSGYQFAMLIYGELNIFRPEAARALLQKAYHALEEGGTLLLEPHTFEAVQLMGQEPATWYTSQGGLFSDQPHLVMEEHFWNAGKNAATTRYFWVDAQTAEVTRYASSMQAYTQDAYRDVLSGCGFKEIEFLPALPGTPPSVSQGLLAILAS